MGRGGITSKTKNALFGGGGEYFLELHNSINAKTLFTWYEVVSLIDGLMATL